MKILINENDLRNLLVNRLGVDLTGKVDMLTSIYHIPTVFVDWMGNHILRAWLYNYGPMYLIHLPDEDILYQHQGKVRDEVVIPSSGGIYTSQEILDELGIPPIGLTLTDIVNTFAEEED
jgi:hypothetical protein